MREQPWARAAVPCSLGLQNLLFKLESLSLSPTHFLTRPPPLPAGISASSLGPRLRGVPCALTRRRVSSGRHPGWAALGPVLRLRPCPDQ